VFFGPILNLLFFLILYSNILSWNYSLLIIFNLLFDLLNGLNTNFSSLHKLNRTLIKGQVLFNRLYLLRCHLGLFVGLLCLDRTLNLKVKRDNLCLNPSVLASYVFFKLFLDVIRLNINSLGILIHQFDTLAIIMKVIWRLNHGWFLNNFVLLDRLVRVIIKLLIAKI